MKEHFKILIVQRYTIIHLKWIIDARKKIDNSQIVGESDKEINLSKRGFVVNELLEKTIKGLTIVYNIYIVYNIKR